MDTIYEHSYVSPKSDALIGGLGDCPSKDKFVRPSCPNWPDKHAVEFPLPDIRRFNVQPRHLADFLWYPGACLVKEAHVEILKSSEFTGIEFRPVELYQGQSCKTPLSGYVEMRVIGRVPIDLGRSGVKVKYRCPLCGVERYTHWDPDKGLHFQGQQEDWPDVFMMDPGITTLTFVKLRFAQFVVDQGFRPVTLTRIEDLYIKT